MQLARCRTDTKLFEINKKLKAFN
ncbi:hypothetical protein EMIT0P260_100072 [Pseudomonas sp. IT-P260]